jgi:hypothetical protein
MLKVGALQQERLQPVVARDGLRVLLRADTTADGCDHNEFDCMRNQSTRAIKQALLTVTICHYYSEFGPLCTTTTRSRSRIRTIGWIQGKLHDDYG